MKNILITMALVLVASSVSAQWVDELYGPATNKKAKKALVVKSSSSTYHDGPTSSLNSATTYDPHSELITSYDEALQRRLNAMRKESYDQPETYWHLLEQYQSMLEKKYNQKLYNIILVGDDIWVEPQYITALFDGSDPASGVSRYNKEISSEYIAPSSSTTQNITIQVNVIDPFDFWGSTSYWNRPYSAYYWNRPYWGWGGGYYPPYWGGGYYPPYWGGGYYPPYWGSGYYPSHHYPSNPRGTYYGNSRNNNRYVGSTGGSYRPTGSRPNSSGNAGLGGARPTRPNGSNTIVGNTRPRPNSTIGGVSTSRPNVNRPPTSGSRPTVERPSISRPTVERPSSTRPTVERPSSTRPTVERPSSTRPTVERPSSTRPTVERPSSTRPTVERPSSTRPTVERPSSGRSSGSSSGGRSSGSSSGGGSRSSGGGGRSR